MKNLVNNKILIKLIIENLYFIQDQNKLLRYLSRQLWKGLGKYFEKNAVPVVL